MSYQVESINEVQRDTVGTPLSNNPYFQSSPVPSLDNSLKTVSKRIVGAINEVVGNVKRNWDSLNVYSIKTDKRLDLAEEKITNQEEMAIEVNEEIIHLNTTVTETYSTITQHIENHPTGTGGIEIRTKVFEHEFMSNELRKYVEIPPEVDITKMHVFVLEYQSSEKLYREYAPVFTSATTGRIYKQYRLFYDPVTNKYYIGPDFYANYTTIIQIFQ